MNWFAPRNQKAVLTARRVHLITFFAVAIWLSGWPALQASVVTEAFVTAVAQIESGGRDAIGDGGKAHGCWQMHEPAWQDSTAFRKRQGWPVWGYESAHDPVVARLYARDYLTILEKQLLRTFGDDVTPELIYAAYNMGFGRFQKLGFLMAKAPRHTQAACARLRHLIADFETVMHKSNVLVTAE